MNRSRTLALIVPFWLGLVLLAQGADFFPDRKHVRLQTPEARPDPARLFAGRPPSQHHHRAARP